MSANISILVADNDHDSLSTCSQFLQKAGYGIVEATTPEDALTLMKTQNLHLAILDLRLRNDADERDRSGLHLAKDAPRVLPKLIWTKFPAYQDVVEVLRPDSSDLPPAVDFVDKREGLMELRGAVERVLREHVQINWELQIFWQFRGSFAQLALALDGTLDGELLAARERELEDLLRRLFVESKQIVLDRVLVQNSNQLFLSLFAHDKAGFESHFILAVGDKTAVLDEKAQYETAVPLRIAKENVEKQSTKSSVHYAATSYILSGQNWSIVESLKQLYHQLPPASLKLLLRTIYQGNIAQWQQGVQQGGSVQAAYIEWLGLPNDGERIYEQMTSLAKAVFQNGQQEKLAHSLLTSPVNDGEFLHLPPEFWALFRTATQRAAATVKWGTTHGQLDLEAIVANHSGNRGWLINFAKVGQRPLLCDFVSLETAVVFSAFPCLSWNDRLAFQQCLLQVTSLEELPSGGHFSEALQKRLHTVIQVRRLASELAGATLDSYFQALFYAAIGYVWEYDGSRFYPQHQLFKFAQAMTTAVIIANKYIGKWSEQEKEQYGIKIDVANFSVMVDKTAVALTNQEFRILHYLYERAGQLCTRDEILAQIEGQDKMIEESRLNSAMSRLRHKIDEHTKRPQKYIVTIRGRGYRLDL